MSCSTVYKIMPDGAVEHFADVRNGSACAPVIWSRLCEKVGLRRWGDEGKLWPLMGTGRFTRDEDVCLAFTFDGAYVRREHIPELVTALRAFWNVVDVPDADGYHISPTIPGLADALERLLAEPEAEVRGACFRMTSVAEHPWWLYARNEDGEREDDDEGRSFNFDHDKINAYRAEVFELVDAVNSKRETEGA